MLILSQKSMFSDKEGNKERVPRKLNGKFKGRKGGVKGYVKTKLLTAAYCDVATEDQTK